MKGKIKTNLAIFLLLTALIAYTPKALCGSDTQPEKTGPKEEQTSDKTDNTSESKEEQTSETPENAKEEQTSDKPEESSPQENPTQTEDSASNDIDPETMKLGKETFIFCMTCHGQDGKGMVMGGKKMAPSMAGSKYINGPKDLLTGIVLKGIKKESDEYLNIMSPLEAQLDDKKLSAVLTYVRNSFGNKSSAVTAQEVKAYRAEWLERKESFSRSKLEKLLLEKQK